MTEIHSDVIGWVRNRSIATIEETKINGIFVRTADPIPTHK